MVDPVEDLAESFASVSERVLERLEGLTGQEWQWPPLWVTSPTSGRRRSVCVQNRVRRGNALTLPEYRPRQGMAASKITLRLMPAGIGVQQAGDPLGHRPISKRPGPRRVRSVAASTGSLFIRSR